MANADANIGRGTALPSIAHMGLGQSPKEELDIAPRHLSTSSGPSIISPTFPYSGPTPPYSHPPSTASAYTSPRMSMASPPVACRPLMKEDNSATRQSLPSISEALGGNPVSRLPAPSSLGASALTSSTPTIRRFTPPTMSSERERGTHTRDRFESDLRSHTQAAVNSQYSATRSTLTAQPPASTGDKIPTLQPLTAGLSPPTYIHSSTSAQAPPHDPLSSRRASAYSATKAPLDSAFVRPVVAPSAAPSYPSTSPYGQSAYQPQWRSEVIEDVKPQASKTARPRYDEIVKRELATYDIQGSLNEFADYGKQLVEFAHYFSDASRQAHRAGHPHIALPSATDLDILLVRSSHLQELLVVMKDVAMVQSAAAKRPISPPHGIKRPLDEDRSTVAGAQQDEGKTGGFAAGEPKKRRGRAAPPGRCHSCNRAETPEWRRGPDGARTLCNACGLHYAKLTRKLNQTSKSGLSNLNPASTGLDANSKADDSP